MIKLVGFWVSPFVLRVSWALKLKGVEYEYIEEDVFNKSPLLLELNPVHKKVPVLVHGHNVIVESFVILEYIDETWKQYPLLPQEPYDRANTRFWAKFAEEKLMRNSWTAMCSQGEEKKLCLQSALEDLEKIEGELKGKGKFFGGENLGYLDLVLGWITYLVPVWEEIGSMTILDPVKFPCITAWMQNFLNHPVIKEDLPPREKVDAYFQNQRKEYAARMGSTNTG
ncbi:Glutathione S-transferase [Actinidia chinensis var. chinensis]|uniref:Probable glutathione S-transferase n=1 Tax=Actinidia chinensis var. chinensis TaxID=1590841 RepID=A0A2R6RUS8_ACTCC|nr:Glutathione S-transferase [Actinidia chinensis var. chinensis]